jgi:hypothetical protein
MTTAAKASADAMTAVSERAKLLPYNLLRRQADIVAALLRNLVADERHYRNWTIEGAVREALALDREPNPERYFDGCELLSEIAIELEHRGNGRYRLGVDEARLLAEVLETVLRSPFDYDFRIENAVVDGLGLDDAPTGRQYDTGEWAIEQARARLTVPGLRPDERPGDLLQIDFDEMIERLPAGAYEIVEVADDAPTIRLDDDGAPRTLSREEIEEGDAWIERRLVASLAPIAEGPAKEPPPAPEPWSKKEMELAYLYGQIRATCGQILAFRRDIAACERGAFRTSDPLRTANKFRKQLVQAEQVLCELKELAATMTEELRAKDARRLDEVLAECGRSFAPPARGLRQRLLAPARAPRESPTSLSSEPGVARGSPRPLGLGRGSVSSRAHPYTAKGYTRRYNRVGAGDLRWLPVAPNAGPSPGNPNFSIVCTIELPWFGNELLAGRSASRAPGRVRRGSA